MTVISPRNPCDMVLCTKHACNILAFVNTPIPPPPTPNTFIAGEMNLLLTSLYLYRTQPQNLPCRLPLNPFIL